MTNLQELISRCKAGISLDINEHKIYYTSIKQYLDRDITERIISWGAEDEINDYLKHYRKIINRDTLIELTFYPENPISSYTIYHYDVEKAADEALVILNK